MVTGIFDVDGGNPFWEAADRYRDAGYAVGWAVRMARRHGDPTSRRRVFLVAVLPECIVDGKDGAEHAGPAARSLRFALLEPPGLGALSSVRRANARGPTRTDISDRTATRRARRRAQMSF